MEDDKSFHDWTSRIPGWTSDVNRYIQYCTVRMSGTGMVLPVDDFHGFPDFRYSTVQYCTGILVYPIIMATERGECHSNNRLMKEHKDVVRCLCLFG